MKKIEQAPIVRHAGNGQPKIGPRYYTRVSSLAKYLDDQGNLIHWMGKMAARGIALSPDLQALAATTDMGDRDKWRDIVDRAKDRAGGNSGADLGTGIHSATEMLDLGQSLEDLPADLRADAEAYGAALDKQGLTPLAGEMFVVNEAVKSAGSFDRLVACQDGPPAILDVKTINADKDAEYACRYNGVAWSIQIATYAHARPYDGIFGASEWSDYDLPAPGLERGWVAVIRRGAGTCDLVEVDLTAGWRMAQLAASVRDARKARPARVVAA